jgi:hypothetical protein
VIETEVKGDISLYDARTEQVLVLNRTASDIWLLCDGQQTLDEIVEMIAQAYGVDASAIRGDVETVLEQFRAEGFIPEW